MTNQYNKIARHYDFLSRLVFFHTQVNAQINQLGYIPANSLILIVGGGTGWILEEITKLHPTGLEIVYVEASSKMIALSKKRNYGGNTIEFLTMGIEDFIPQNKYNVLLTPFLFDNFTEETAVSVHAQLDCLLKDKGLWLFTDFNVEGKGYWWKSAFLKFIYTFFTVFKIIEASRFIAMAPYFKERHYKKINERLYYGTFIEGIVYKKQRNLPDLS